MPFIAQDLFFFFCEAKGENEKKNQTNELAIAALCSWHEARAKMGKIV